MLRSTMVGLVLLLAAAQAEAAPFEVTVEGRVGPYIPDTDPGRGFNALDVSSGPSAFGCSMGLGIRPIGFISPQISVFDAFGTFLLGVEGGFYHMRSRQLTNANDCTSNVALTTNELTVLPVLATLTYRFDWALDHFKVPLVPYLRLGIGGAGWVLTENGELPRSSVLRSTDPATGQTSYRRQDAVGFSFGGKVAGGLMLALDFLEPLRALSARGKGVYKHSFIFLEVAGFDAGMYENSLIYLLQRQFPSQTAIGPTLVVGAERLPLITGGLAVAF